MAEIYEFGPFVLDVREGRVLRAGVPVALTPKAFEALILLVRSAGRLVTREELMQALWPDTAVSEGNLKQNIWVLRRALDTDPEATSLIETVPRRGYRFVAPVTSSAAAPATVSTPDPPPPARRRSPGKALGILVVAAGAMFIAFSRGDTAVPPALRRPPLASVRRTVVLVGFRDLAPRPETAWLGDALCELLGVELAASDALRVVPGDEVAHLRRELSLSSPELLAGDGLARLRQRTGADVVVMGSYLDLGERSEPGLRIDVRLQDARGGEIAVVFSETGPERELLRLVSALGVRLRGGLDSGPLPPAERQMLAAAQPRDLETARLYAEGLVRLRLFDANGARVPLAQAVARDPEFPLAHAALSTAWSSLGFDRKALEEAQAAATRATALAPRERLLIEARAHAAANQWPQAIEAYRALRAFFPDELEYGLNLATAQVSAGHARDALAGVAALRSLPSPWGQDARIDLLEARAADAVGDNAAVRRAALAAAEKARALGARWLLASALRWEAFAAERLGDGQHALDVHAQERTIRVAVGDRVGEAWTLNNAANVEGDLGRPEAARRMYAEAREIFGAAGHRSGESKALNNLAVSLRAAGDLAGALELYQQSLTLKREIEDRQGQAATLNNMGNVFLDLGDTAQARRHLEQALALRREIGDQRGTALALHNLAGLLAETGALAEARRDEDQALAIATRLGDAQRSSEILERTGDLCLAAGDLAAARTHYARALALAEGIGDVERMASARLRSAELALEAGAPADAERDARQAAEGYEHGSLQEEAAAARLVVARALAAQGRRADAAPLLSSALARLQQSPRPRVRAEALLAQGRFLLASGERAACVAPLDQARREARRLGLVALDIDARIALAEAGGAPGSTLPALRREAEAHGYLLLARRAGG